MQPDTTPLKLARDITTKMNERSQGTLPSNEQSQNDNRQEAEHAQAQATDEVSPIPETAQSQIQVVSLYTPESSAIKFFCVHPSHRYAMSLMPIATGFQEQVNLASCIRADEDFPGNYGDCLNREQRHLENVT